MLVTGLPGQPDILAGLNLAEPVESNRDRLTVDVAQHDAVGPEMLDGLDPRGVIATGHDADVLRPNPDETISLTHQVHRRCADEPCRERRRRPVVEFFRRAVLLDAAIAHQD